MKEKSNNKKVFELYIVLGFWIFVSVLFTLKNFLSGNILNFSLSASFLLELISLSPWVLAVIIIKTINDKLSSNNKYVVIVFHIFAAVLIFSLHSSFQTFINSLFLEQSSFDYKILKADFIQYFDIRSLLYVGILIGYSYDKYFFKKGRLLHQTEAMKTELERARLSSFINNIQPDFLINNINELSKIIDTDTERAKESLVSLSDLIRSLVKYSKRDKISKEEDASTYKYYIDFLSQKINRKIQFIPKFGGENKKRPITKSFFVIPLIDSIINYCSKRYLDSLDKIYYTILEQSDNPKLVLKLSNIPDLDAIQVNLLFQNFLSEVSEYNTNLDTLKATEIEKKADSILIKMQLD